MQACLCDNASYLVDGRIIRHKSHEKPSFRSRHAEGGSGREKQTETRRKEESQRGTSAGAEACMRKQLMPQFGDDALPSYFLGLKPVSSETAMHFWRTRLAPLRSVLQHCCLLQLGQPGTRNSPASKPDVVEQRLAEMGAS